MLSSSKWFILGLTLVSISLVKPTVSHADTAINPQLTTSTTTNPLSPRTTNLAGQYDPRLTGATTPVQNQSFLDLCWAYTANDVIALSLGKHSANTYQFSANYYNYLVANNAFRNARNPLAQDRKLDTSGDDNLAETLAFLGYTPVSNDTFKTPAFPINQAKSTKSLVKIGKTGIKADIQAVYTIAGSKKYSPKIINNRTALIKSDISNYGAESVAINAYTSFDYLVSRDNKYSQQITNGDVTTYVPFSALNKISTNTNYGWQQVNFNHQLTIVGWNDNYDRHNFIQTPKHNGAFLVKNTWGTNVLDKGYAWMSYEDVNLLQSDLHSVKTGKYNTNTQYRQVNGATNSSITLKKHKYTFVATSYTTANTSSKLTRFGFYTLQNNLDYRLYVTKRTLNTKKLTSLQGFTKVASGNIRRAGLQKITLPKAYKLGRKQHFTIAIRLMNSDQQRISLPVQIISTAKHPVYPFISSGASYLSQTDKNLKWVNYSKNSKVNFYLLAYTNRI